MTTSGQPSRPVVIGLGPSPLAPMLAEALQHHTGRPVDLSSLRGRYGEELVGGLERAATHPGARVVVGRAEPGLWQLVAAAALTFGPTGPVPVVAVLLAVPDSLLKSAGIVAAPYPFGLEWLVEQLETEPRPVATETDVHAGRRLLRLDWHALKHQLRLPSSPERPILLEFVHALKSAPVVRMIAGDAGLRVLELERLLDREHLASGAIAPSSAHGPWGTDDPSWQALAAICYEMERRLGQ